VGVWVWVQSTTKGARLVAVSVRMSDRTGPIGGHAGPPVIFKGIAEHTDLAVRSTEIPNHVLHRAFP